MYVIEYDKAFTSYEKQRSQGERDKKIASAAGDVTTKEKLAKAALKNLNKAYIIHQALIDKSAHMEAESVIDHGHKDDDNDDGGDTEVATQATQQKQVVNA